MNRNEYLIKVGSFEEGVKICRILEALGEKIYEESCFVTGDYIRLYVEKGEKVVDIGEFVSLFMANRNNFIDIGEGYTAEISKRGITVGCQTFSFEAFDRLAAGVAKFRE